MEPELIDQQNKRKTINPLYRKLNKGLLLLASLYYLYLFARYFNLKYDDDSRWLPYYVVNFRYGAEVYQGFVFTLGLVVAQVFGFFNKYLLSSILILLAFIATFFAPRLMMLW